MQGLITILNGNSDNAIYCAWCGARFPESSLTISDSEKLLAKKHMAVLYCHACGRFFGVRAHIRVRYNTRKVR